MLLCSAFKRVLNYGVLYLLMLIESALIILFALFLDLILGEPRRYHPLAGFGYCANRLETRLIRDTQSYNRVRGALAMIILILPVIAGIIFIQSTFHYPQLIDILLLYFAIGRKSLLQHAQVLIKPLQANDLNAARQKVAMIVSRDTSHMQQNDIIKATLETVIENSNDAIFGAIFWFAIAGAPGAIIYRLVNTLDAMWGYKNKRFMHFGWAAAKLDDALNWLPARLTVLSFSLFAKSLKIIPQSFQQGKKCASPNAGPVMSAGAYALGIKLGGDAYYQGRKISKPILGYGRDANTEDIQRSMKLVNTNVLIWLIAISAIALIAEVLHA